MQAKERLDFVDGLRGLAILGVLLDHSVWFDYHTLGQHPSVFRLVFTVVALQGYQGVSLFLVLSGFCLSYPALKRRREGRSDWFSPGQFFLRRCRRILPPYYASLAICLVLATWFPGRLMGPQPDLANVASHIFLVHNLTPYSASLNGPFWSLGLEWQWYLVFPLIFMMVVRSPLSALLLSLCAAVCWHLGTHDLWLLFHSVSAALPVRLFEFCCGIVVARVVVSDWQPRGPFCSVLAWFIFLPLLASVVTPIQSVLHALIGQPQPLFGVAFGALVLLGHYSGRARQVLSARPLVGLGVVSYSVYLVHDPIVTGLQYYAPPALQQWALLTTIAAATGIAAGTMFYWLIERPCMAPDFWANLIPRLRRSYTRISGVARQAN